MKTKQTNSLVTSSSYCLMANDLKLSVKETIVNLMKKYQVKFVDFLLDKNGNSCDDEGYDDDWVYDNRCYAECYNDNSGNESGYISSVTIDDKGRIRLFAEGEENGYSHDYVEQTLEVYIGVLARIEAIYN